MLERMIEGEEEVLREMLENETGSPILLEELYVHTSPTKTALIQILSNLRRRGLVRFKDKNRGINNLPVAVVMPNKVANMLLRRFARECHSIYKSGQALRDTNLFVPALLVRLLYFCGYKKYGDPKSVNSGLGIAFINRHGAVAGGLQ